MGHTRSIGSIDEGDRYGSRTAVPCEPLPVRVEITEQAVIVIILGNDDRCTDDVNEDECERDEHSQEPFPRFNRGQFARGTTLVFLLPRDDQQK